MGSRTITQTGARRRAAPGSEPFLFVVLRSDRPQRPGPRFRLAGAQSVTLGRDDRYSTQGEGGARRIGLPDSRVSATHLRIERVLGQWVAEDQGSKNGTLVDGRRIAREPLGDGAILELGHTFLLFREAIPATPGPEILDGATLDAPAPGFATLLPPLAAELERLQRVAASRIPILLQGESGSGKEVFAAAIHRLSGRPGRLQPVNCGAIAPNLVESELFGHRKGAFSGAIDDQPGLVRGADRGTLLLDEIGDLPAGAQAALLRVLQESEVLPVGGGRAVPVDLRVIAATHRDLQALVAEERFRADLLARLSGYACTLPPLRERREDFSLLVAALLARIGADGASFAAEAARALLRYAWPLNVRELEKCLSAAVALSGGGEIAPEHLPAAVRSPTPRAAAPDDGKRQELIALLEQNGGNITAVARSMGKARTQVQRWLRRLHLDPGSYRH